MHRTLLLCFIHGFKGGDDTFANFPGDLRALISHALPNISVRIVTYPKYETRGDLRECVGRFREWLQNKVIDLEVAASTPSPTIDPSVHTILLGHSMGGIVAAETLLSICADSPIPPSTTAPADPLPSTAAHTEPTSVTSLLFPYIAGILSFDTPYLGIAPSVIAYGAESQYQTVNSAYSAFTAATSFFGGKSPKTSTPSTPTSPVASQALPAPEADAAATPAWQRWGKYAMFAGAAGAVAAGGAAAYLKRDKLTEGWGWIGSHLEFVGCLARREELKTRLERLVSLTTDKKIGFRDVVTILGKGANHASKKEREPVQFGPGGMVEVGGSTTLERRERTFCTLPKSADNGQYFELSKNDLAQDETEAHMSMFERNKNSHYYVLIERAKELVVGWVEDGEWYTTSELKDEPVEENRRSSIGLMDVDLNDHDLDKDEVKGREWATGEEPVWVNK